MRKAAQGSNPWLDRRMVGFAHQGGALEGRPNTIAAMRNALAAGSSALEFDVHRTRDEQLVHHDPELEVNGRRLRIAATDLSDLREVRPDLATLEEALSEFPGVTMTVEIKAFDAAAATARRLAAEMGARPLIVTAFSPRTVRAVRRVAPRLETAPAWTGNLLFWLASRMGVGLPLPQSHVALQVALRLDQVAVVKKIPGVRSVRVADRRLVASAARRGLAVHVWTLNEREPIEDAIAAGAHGIFTDRPAVLTSVLREHGLHWQRIP